MRIALAVGVLAQAVAASSSLANQPGTALCDGFAKATRGEQIRRITDFHRAIDGNSVLALRQNHVECIADRLQDVTPRVGAYCTARQELGHDLALHELFFLDSELSTLALDCDRELDRFREEQIGEFIPNSCTEIALSELSMRKWLLDREKIGQAEFECARRRAPEIVGPLQAKCQAGELSLRASTIEYMERMGRVCPLPSQAE
jgi:hypothetical protein